jgi:class 3 adenylate cyclase
VITAAEAARMHAAAAPGGICIEAAVIGDEPGVIDRIAAVLLPWLSGPSEPEREAEL